jgi:hypothetical protein
VFWPRAQNGAVSGISPVADWPARTSPMNRRVKASTSMLKAAASQKIWASPVQPMRSSRCGQSVGMPTKLPRWLHRVLRQIAWTIGLSMRATPVRAASLCRTTPSMSVSGAGDLDIAEAMEGEARLPGLAGRIAAQDVGVGLQGPAVGGGVQRSVRLQGLGEAQFDAVARRPFTRIRHQPEKFWPKSTMRTPGLGVADLRPASGSGWRGSGARLRGDAPAASRPGGPASRRWSSKPGASQPASSRRASWVSPS